jgi:ketosteroid isomerase-like protein
VGRAELAVLRQIYGDWERGNFRRTDYLARDYEFVFARDFLDGGRFRGDEDVSRAWRAWVDQWASWRVIPLEYLEVGDRIGVRILVEGISKSSGMTLTQESGNVFDFRDGLPWRITVYTRSETMLEDLGLESS